MNWMTTLINRSQPAGWCLLAALLACVHPGAVAQVSLEYGVQKVEVSEDGEGNTRRLLVSAERVNSGDELRYTISFVNEGSEPLDAGSVVISTPVPEGTEYLEDSAQGFDTDIAFSADEGSSWGAPEALLETVDGQTRVIPAVRYTHIRWIYRPALAAGADGRVAFNVRMK